MNRTLIAIGVLLASLWMLVTFISLGLEPSLVDSILRFTPALLHDAVFNIQNGFYYYVYNSEMPTIVFLIIFTLAFILYILAILIISRREATKATFVIILLFGAIFRFILLPSVAVHENDIYRYLWDGKVLKHGVNPFKYAPAQIEDSQEEEISKLNSIREENQVYFSRIGHKSVPTIYPPVAQGLFLLSSVVKEDSIFVTKLIFVIFDLLSIFLIYKILKVMQLNPSMSIIYVWSPLLLKEIPNSGHYDTIAIFFLLLSLWMMLIGKRIISSTGLALAVLSKFFPVALLPLYLRRIKLKGIVLFGVISIAAYLPFIFLSDTGIRRVFAGLVTYSKEWAYNGSIFVMIRIVLNLFGFDMALASIIAKFVCALILISIAAYFFLRPKDGNISFLKRAFIIFASIFLLSPVGDPWYFSWVLPFLCFFPMRSFILLSGLLVFSYLSFGRDVGFFYIFGLEIDKLTIIQYLPFYILFFIELSLKRARKISYV